LTLRIRSGLSASSPVPAATLYSTRGWQLGCDRWQHPGIPKGDAWRSSGLFRVLLELKLDEKMHSVDTLSKGSLQWTESWLQQMIISGTCTTRSRALSSQEVGLVEPVEADPGLFFRRAAWSRVHQRCAGTPRPSTRPYGTNRKWAYRGSRAIRNRNLKKLSLVFCALQ
jgi:hypothetical protein